MPEIVKEMLIRAPLDNTWALVSDMEKFSLCIPGCNKVEKISDTEFDWDLETRVMRTTRKAKARTRTVTMRSPTHAEFVGEGRLFERSNHYKLTIKGTTDLEVVSDDITRIRFAGDVKASGVGGAIIEKVAAGQMDDLFREFEKNVKQALGDTGELVSEAEAAAAPEAGDTQSEQAERHLGQRLAWIGVAVMALAVLLYALILR